MITNYKLGDKVRFVNEQMEGVVTAINGKVIGVTIEDDFEIPVAANELVKIEEKITPAKEPAFITKKTNFVQVHSGVHIAFERLSEVNLELKLHNSESDFINFAYFIKQGEHFILHKQGTVALETHISLGHFNLEEFNTWPEMAFQIMYINGQTNSFKPQLIKTIKFNAKEFHANFKQCYFLGKQAYTFRLNEAINVADLKRQQQKDFNEPLSKPIFITEESLFKKPQPIVDLHIEKLTDSSTALTAQQIVDLQMKVLSKSLEMAHVHHMQKIIFIHGIGNHFLKNKLKNYLSQNKELVKSYAAADASQYGGGATEVLLN
jgi:dsDNA-specific endonuclease/ATPase MutS2